MLVLASVSVAAATASASASAASDASGETGVPPPFGPQDIPPGSRLAERLRVLSLWGDVPDGFWTTRPASRHRAGEACLRVDRRADTPPAESQREPAAVLFRVRRELAGELGSLDASSPDSNGATVRIPIPPEVPPLLEWSFEGGRTRLRPYARLHGKWKDGRGVSWGETPRVGVQGAVHWSPQWALHGDLFAGRVADARLFGDAIIADTDFVAFMETAYLAYDAPRVGMRFGRRRLAWGPGIHGNLLISAPAAPIDQVAFELPLGRFRFLSVVGVLSVPLEKNVALHRLEWRPSDRLVISASEGAIFPGSPAQPLYLVGLVPYTLVERVHAQDAVPESDFDDVRNNLLWSADLWWRVDDGRAVWAQVLVDDVATETAEMPSRLGFLVGGESWRTLGRGAFGLGLEASKIYNYTYSVFYENADWSHQGAPLGGPEGPDSETVRATARWLSAQAWECGLELFWLRNGEGRLGVPWYPSSDPRSAGNASQLEYALSGVVETRLGLEADVTFEPSAAWNVSLRWRGAQVRNRNHRARGWQPEARLDLVLEAHR